MALCGVRREAPRFRQNITFSLNVGNIACHIHRMMYNIFGFLLNQVIPDLPGTAFTYP